MEKETVEQVIDTAADKAGLEKLRRYLPYITILYLISALAYQTHRVELRENEKDAIYKDYILLMKDEAQSKDRILETLKTINTQSNEVLNKLVEERRDSHRSN